MARPPGFEPLTSCVNLGKLLNFPEPQFPQLCNREENNTSAEGGHEDDVS